MTNQSPREKKKRILRNCIIVIGIILLFGLICFGLIKGIYNYCDISKLGNLTNC